MTVGYPHLTMTTAIVIRNPASRHSMPDARLQAALDYARHAGWTIEVVTTEREKHATEIARAAATRGVDVDVVIVNGGDGTINEVINGIANTGAALAVIPAGTANIWAKEMHISRDPAIAVREMVHGVRRRIDLGRANGRYFLLMAGVGFDGEIVPRVSTQLKRRVGAFSYVLVGAKQVLRARQQDVRMTIDGRGADGPLYWMVVGNTRSYGGLADIAHHAIADDGLLDAVIMRRGGIQRVIVDGVRLLRQRHDQSPNVDYANARRIVIDTPGLPVQVDGEYCGETPMRIEVAPLALTAVVPATLRTPLLGCDERGTTDERETTDFTDFTD